MNHNQFRDELSVPEGLRLPSYGTAVDIAIIENPASAYHGSPFSPTQMSEVFARSGYRESDWAVVPVQPYHLDNNGAVEPFGDGPSISAGRVPGAYSRAFLNKKADHFIALPNAAGFSSTGFLDAANTPHSVVPQAVGERLAARQPTGFLYRMNVSLLSGFKPAEFDDPADAARDSGEYRSRNVEKPLGVRAVSFAEFCEVSPTIVADCTFEQLKALENRVAAEREPGAMVTDLSGVIELLTENRITASLLSEL